MNRPEDRWTRGEMGCGIVVAILIAPAMVAGALVRRLWRRIRGGR